MDIFRLTIRKKINLILIGLQIATVVGVVTLATYLFTEDLPGVLRKTNFDVASILASRVRSEFKLATDRMSSLGAASLEEFKVEDDKFKFLEDLIAADNQLYAVSLYELDTTEPKRNKALARWRVINSTIEGGQKLNNQSFEELDRSTPIDFSMLSNGKTDIKVVKSANQNPVIRLAIPFYEQSSGYFTQFLVAEVNPDRFAALFNEASAFTISLVNSNLKVLASNDTQSQNIGAKVNEKLLNILSQSELSQAKQVDYNDADGQVQMASIHPVRFAGLTIVSEAPYGRVDRAKKTLYKRTGLLSIAVVCLSIWFAILFSSGFQNSVSRLAEAADRVANGDYHVRLPVKERGFVGLDELEEFSETFNKMAEGLNERNKVKSAFSKLHSKDVAEKLINGDLKLGGERKDCVVFFSDIRDFTNMSEKMDPEHIVSILNRYFTVMIRIIDRYNGNVTSFLGDGIMAVWGISNNEPVNVDNAIKACLEMRVALDKFNQELIREGRKPLKIGMGLHYGPAILGNVGSNTRMEYTVIGDTTNTASRVESATKEFGTDLLVSAQLLEKARNQYVVEKVNSRLKGKSNVITLYKMYGYVDSKGMQVLIRTPYSEFAAERSEKSVYDYNYIDVSAEDDEITVVDRTHAAIDHTLFKKSS
jgi:adenylate cyclase